MTMPNFILLGGNRCGSTWLHNTLAQHPEIFMSETKEPHYFTRVHRQAPNKPNSDMILNQRWSMTDDRESYEALFSGAGGARVCGESSTGYLCDAGAARSIHAEIPEVKLAAVLRNPIQRAYSNYLFYLRIGVETRTDFLEALIAQADESPGEFGLYVSQGMYGCGLKAYLELFDRGQIRLYLFEDFVLTRQKALYDLLSFLAVDSTTLPASSLDKNEGRGRPRSKHALQALDLLEKFIRRPEVKPGIARARSWLYETPPHTPAARAYLTDVFREDIGLTQEILGRNLSHWLEC